MRIVRLHRICGRYPIHVTTLGGETITLEVEASYTIQQVKEMLSPSLEGVRQGRPEFIKLLLGLERLRRRACANNLWR